MHNKRLLIAMFVPHALVEMRGVIQRCIEAGWKVDILLGYAGATAKVVEMYASQAGIGLYRAPANMTYGADVDPEVPLPGWIDRLPGFGQRILKALIVLTRLVKEMRGRAHWARSLLKEARPNILLMHNFQSAGQLDRALLVAGKQASIPSICLLVSPMVSRSISRRARPAQMRSGMVPATFRVDYDIFNRAVGHLAPSWWTEEGGIRVFFAHPVNMLAAWLAGLGPRDVWQVPAEEFDHIVVPTARAGERLVSDGHPRQKVTVAGLSRLDEAIALASNQAEIARLYSALGVDPLDSFVLWNMEPALEHNYATAEVHWDRVALIRDALACIGRKIVISLHPLCAMENYRFIEEDDRFVIARNYGIHHLYPFCRFVLSFGCSTDVYAGTFGKTVVFYDWIGESEHPERFAEMQVPGMVVERDPLNLVHTLKCVDAAAGDVAKRQANSVAVPASSVIERVLAAHAH